MTGKILIVDDNEKNRKLLRFMLEKSGYETLEAADGEEGVRMAKEHLPALVLMDIQMPVMDGMRACNLIRADEVTRHIPVVAVTSYSMKGDREKFMNEGFAAYLAKPINRDALLTEVNHILTGSHE